MNINIEDDHVEHVLRAITNRLEELADKDQLGNREETTALQEAGRAMGVDLVIQPSAFGSHQVVRTLYTPSPT